MTESLYERYKDALRRGHVAVGHSRFDLALDAYSEAARLAPDRALPFIGIGSVLTKLARADEALAAYDAALERAPADEAALRARAELLTASGDRVAAAQALDRLAGVLDGSGRRAEALDLSARALELAESRSRRAGLAELVERAAPEAAADPGLGSAILRAQGLLEGLVAGTPDEPPPPPFDPGAATAAVEAAAAGGDPVETRALALAAATGHRAGGRIHAAIDACYLALATNPDDPDLHLTLAELYLDRGWRSAAADKLVLLARLVELTDDAPGRERLCAVVSARLVDDPRLTAVCA